MAFNGSGKRLASSTADGTMLLWNADTGERLAALRGPHGRRL